MKNVQKIDLGLTGYDELFANDEERKVNKLPRIFDIPISEIDDFPDHPFKVKIDEDMDQLVQSTVADCDCKYCLYYGGRKNREVNCLADECVCKAELQEAARRERKENGSKNQ